METINITKPTPADEAATLAFIESFYAVGEEWVPGSAGLDMNRDYPAWLAYLARVEQGDTSVFLPNRAYLAKNGAGVVVGIVDVRPEMPSEKMHFGHVGYSVAPAHRRRGIAAQLLAFATATLREAGLDRAVACCYDDNMASIATLLGGGYHKADAYTEEPGKKVLVFQYNLNKTIV